MAPLIYIDTNIYLDYLFERKDRIRPLNEFAFLLLQKSISCKYTIIVSSLLTEELQYQNALSRVREIFKSCPKEKIVQCIAEIKDITLARHITATRKTHFNDTLHAILANKKGAEFLVTRNIKDFIALQDIVKLVLPENL